MAEKKKQEDTAKSEGNREFLEKTGVSSWMRDALAKIVANRPDDPVEFLAQYFVNTGEKSNKTTRAYQMLMQTGHTRPAFKTNVATAYEILSSPTSSKSLSGVTGAPYRDLLDMVCRGISQPIYNNFLKKVGPRDHELIPYSVFYSGLLAAFILVEYYHQTQALFSLVCYQKSTETVIDRYLAETLVTTLTDSIYATQSNDPLMVLEAGARFSDEDLSDEIVEAMTVSQSSSRSIMNQDEFLEAAVNVYLSEVKPIR